MLARKELQPKSARNHLTTCPHWRLCAAQSSAAARLNLALKYSRPDISPHSNPSAPRCCGYLECARLQTPPSKLFQIKYLSDNRNTRWPECSGPNFESRRSDLF